MLSHGLIFTAGSLTRKADKYFPAERLQIPFFLILSSNVSQVICDQLMSFNRFNSQIVLVIT